MHDKYESPEIKREEQVYTQNEVLLAGVVVTPPPKNINDNIEE